MLKKIVSKHTTSTPCGKVVNLYALDGNAEFRKAVEQEVLALIEKIPHACVLIPSGKARLDNPLRDLVMELAMTLQVQTLVTGAPENLRRLEYSTAKDVILIKQSFKTGAGLKKEIEEVRAQGCTVRVICMIAHKRASIDAFAKENNVEISTLVCLDEE